PRVNLAHFSSYHSWYFDSDTGKASSEWLYAKIMAYTAELVSEEQMPLISVESVKHPGRLQIICMVPPDALDSDPTTILSAHIDSLN
ncbi:hypothetical protein DFH07DRAFT_704418, partial [Mycena maculata]